MLEFGCETHRCDGRVRSLRIVLCAMRLATLRVRAAGRPPGLAAATAATEAQIQQECPPPAGLTEQGQQPRTSGQLVTLHERLT